MWYPGQSPSPTYLSSVTQSAPLSGNFKMARTLSTNNASRDLTGEASSVTSPVYGTAVSLASPPLVQYPTASPAIVSRNSASMRAPTGYPVPVSASPMPNPRQLGDVAQIEIGKAVGAQQIAEAAKAEAAKAEAARLVSKVAESQQLALQAEVGKAFESQQIAEAAKAEVVRVSKAAEAQQLALQAKIEALEKEALDAKAQIEAHRQATETMKKDAESMKDALAEAQAAKFDEAVKAATAAAASRPRPLPAPPPPVPTRAPANDEQLIGKLSMEELDHHYDVVVIGGGPVGVAAVMKAAVLGHRAILVDKPKVAPMPNGLDVSFGGPTGLWSKALRDTGKHVDVPALQSMHLDDDVIWHQVRNMCLRLASANASHQVKTLRNFKIAYLQATATVIDSKNVLVDQGQGGEPCVLKSDFVMVATGSKPMRPKEIPFDDYRIFDSDSINALSFLPKSVAVLGSGIIAIEYAKIFRKLGVQVFMLVRSECLSALERIGLDRDIAAKLIEVLHDDDVIIYENTSVVDWDVPMSIEDGPLTLKLKSKMKEVPSQIQVDVFLAATGRTANTAGWGAEKLGIKIHEKGFVEVNDKYETSVEGVYAVGDVIGPPSLASTGVYQAQCAMLEMFGQGHMNKFDQFPVGMWTTPECGYYGMTLAAAKKKGIDAKEGCVSYDSCLRGRVFAPIGLLKLVFRVDDGVIIGVHILGDDACELVHFGMDLVKQQVSIFKVLTTCFTAVTFHELFKEAAYDANSQLEFGMEWHKILEDIGSHLDNHEHELDMEKMEMMWKEAGPDSDGHLDWKGVMNMFQRYGCNIDRATASNLVRLAAKPGECTVGWGEFEKIFDILEDVRDNNHFKNEDSSAKTKDVEVIQDPTSPTASLSPRTPGARRRVSLMKIPSSNDCMNFSGVAGA